MTLVRITDPAYGLDCDECGTTFRAQPGSFAEVTGYNALRADAADAGWQIRPPFGPGSRKAPDFCPTCKPKGTDR